MSSKFIANFSEGYMLNMSQDLIMNAVKAALNDLGWQHKVLSPIQVEAKLGMSIWSFGEKMTITIAGVGVVNVESRGNSSIYHDKNKSNVITFLTQLKQTTLAYAAMEAKANYQKSLQKLKNNPVDANLRGMTLELGRIYSNLTRNEAGLTAFDEMALMVR
jgi:hypothetical protein